jgi:hypothetical protein
MRSFATISVLGVFVTTVLAAPSVQKRQDGQEVKLAIQQIKSTSESDIAVTDPKTSQLLGHACSTTLNSGAFANLPISADLDHMAGTTVDSCRRGRGTIVRGIVRHGTGLLVMNISAA